MQLAAVIEQLAHLRGHPAVAEQAAAVVVHHGDERVRFLARVAEYADHLVPVAVGVRVQVAVSRGHGAEVVRPAGPGDAPFDQFECGSLGLGRLGRGAEAGDAGQQGQRGRGGLLRRVLDQALADEFFHPGLPAQARPPRPGAPPGAEHLADQQLGIEGAAHGQQFAGGAQHLGEQRRRW